MSNQRKCKSCGSTDIEEDPARGDVVCTRCGSVMQDSIVVNEVQFEEIRHGATAIGQFVAADSTGGATSYGYGKFQVGSGNESREVTMKKAKKEITHLCQQLQLSQHCTDSAIGFFKMALMRQMTRGRKSSHIYAACVYLTCRMEGTSHLLIDVSDVQQICSYELGKTYLKLSSALCIKIPAMDPCLYVLRFASKLAFGGKTHEVAMTALRIVQRMKKDSIHSGRRPTGLCGAALLIAARMHDFSRDIQDVVRVVKIHETTVRKRLMEFSETPSSALTLDEFMSVDLEAEQDPPAFKAARKKDRDRIKEIADTELTVLQKEIDTELESEYQKTYKDTLRRYVRDETMSNIKFESNNPEEVNDATMFVEANDLTVLGQIIGSAAGGADCKNEKKEVEGLAPDLESFCQPSTSELREAREAKQSKAEEAGTLDLTGLDDDELIGYIMTETEAKMKSNIWTTVNAQYLEDVKTREEKLAKEREEGKPEKKKRKPRRKPIGPSVSAGEAFEKMLQEKKISSKINYEILRTLMEKPSAGGAAISAEAVGNVKTEKVEVKEEEKSNLPPAKIPKLEFISTEETKPTVIGNKEINSQDEMDEDTEVEAEAEPEVEPEREYSSLKDMLNQGDEDDYYGYDEEHY